jgi:phasin family protein
MNDTVKQVEETVKAATAEATTQATEMFKDINVKAKGALAKVGDISKDAVEFSKANLEAVVESGKIAAKGAQTAAQSAAELGRKNFEATTAVLKQVAAVKSPTEFFKLQGDFARSQFDSAVAEMSKSSEFYLKLAGEVFQPIQNRYSVAAEQVKARMAA